MNPTMSKSRPKVIVGLDFGTTFSGFAYALASEPEKIRKFYDWPDAKGGARNYCKTQTSLLYVTGDGSAHSYVVDDWGYSALAKHAKFMQSPKGQVMIKRKSGTHSDGNHSDGNDSDGKHRGKAFIEPQSGRLTRLTSVTRYVVEYDGFERGSSKSHIFLTNFKLLLAEPDHDPKLPQGLTVRKVISDYLRKLSGLVLNVLQKEVGSHISMDDIQWCLTVPALWDEQCKQEMMICAEMGGLVQGPRCSDHVASPHPLIIVLEPEAASAYCQQILKFPFEDGDKFLVVDIGGGTVDLVLHEKTGLQKVREVSPSSGGLFGGTLVDHNFLIFVSQKIKCFPKFCEEEPQSVLKLRAEWETIKHGFDDNMHSGYEFELGAKLARAWEIDEKLKNSQMSQDASFDTINLSLEDMLSIFDPVVNEILALIRDKMIGGLRAIMLVGGFSGSPYLVKRIKKAFSQQVQDIIVPPEPGCAICCGAVTYGVMGADLVSSRIAKKTYGADFMRPFQSGDPVHLRTSGEGGETLCGKVFRIYVQNGDEVALDKCVSRVHRPLFSNQTSTTIGLYSTLEPNPEFVDEPGVKWEGVFTVKHPSFKKLGEWPNFIVSMYFGRTTVEVKAVGTNFGKGELFKMPAVAFEKSLS